MRLLNKIHASVFGMVRVYGSKESGKHPSETQELITFFSELRRKYPDLAEVATHVKNEGKRTIGQISMDRACGLVKGFADIIIIGSPPFVCELKSLNSSSKVSKAQKDFLEKSSKKHAFSCVAYGYKNALRAVDDWLAGM